MPTDTTPVIEAISICPPACRMVCVVAYTDVKDPEELDPSSIMESGFKSGHDIYDVLAIKATVFRNFVKRRGDCDTSCGSQAELIRDGWRSIYQGDDYECVVCDKQGNIGPASELFDAETNAIRAFVCRWPSELDEEKLSAQIAELRAESLGKAHRNRNRERTASGGLR